MSDEKALVTQVSERIQPDSRSMVDVQSSRAIAEVQGAMAIAKRFPRNENEAYSRIMKACARKSLAEVAVYEYPRGGTKVTGPSIRMAEALAQNWGNLDTGVIELERRDGESQAMAYCVDLETNYRKTVIFAVPHVRDTKSGQSKLKDSRDIYETVMNNGSRRLRNCILAVIPGDIVDAALEACEKTLTTDKEPLGDRVRKMVAAMDSLGVTSKMIELKFGHRVEALSERQLVTLRAIYQSIRDGVGSVKDFFEDPSTASEVAKLVDKADKKEASQELPKEAQATGSPSASSAPSQSSSGPAASASAPTASPAAKPAPTAPKKPIGTTSSGSFDPTTLFPERNSK